MFFFFSTPVAYRNFRIYLNSLQNSFYVCPLLLVDDFWRGVIGREGRKELKMYYLNSHSCVIQKNHKFPALA
jgi:hypothetical protein